MRSMIISDLHHTIFSVNLIEEGEMGWTCSLCGKHEGWSPFGRHANIQKNYTKTDTTEKIACQVRLGCELD